MNKQIFEYSVDLIQALLWQHNDAPRITALLRLKNAWYTENVGDFWSEWLRDVFDMRTANAFGLKVWSLILGLPLNTVVNVNSADPWGFGEFNMNFNKAPFGTSGNNVAAVALEDARKILRLRYFQITCRPTIPEVNAFLKDLFTEPEGVYTLDANDMSYVTYSFGFNPGDTLIDLFTYYDVLPRPSAVGVRIIVEGQPVFGFGEFNQNFNRAPFAAQAGDNIK